MGLLLIKIDPKDDHRNSKQRPFQRSTAKSGVKPEAEEICPLVAYGDG